MNRRDTRRDSILLVAFSAQEQNRLPLSAPDIVAALRLNEETALLEACDDIRALADLGLIRVTMKTSPGTADAPIIALVSSSGIAKVTKDARTPAGTLSRYYLFLAERHRAFRDEIGLLDEMGIGPSVTGGLVDNTKRLCGKEISIRLWSALESVLDCCRSRAITTEHEALMLFHECMEQRVERLTAFADINWAIGGALLTETGNNDSEYAVASFGELRKTLTDEREAAENRIRQWFAAVGTGTQYGIINHGNINLQDGSGNTIESSNTSGMDTESIMGLLVALHDLYRSENSAIATLVERAKLDFVQNQKVSSVFTSAIQSVAVLIQTVGELPSAYGLISAIATLAHITLPALLK